MTAPARDPGAALDALGAIEGLDIAVEADAREFHSQDVYSQSAQPVAAVASPDDAKSLHQNVESAAAAG